MTKLHSIPNTWVDTLRRKRTLVEVINDNEVVLVISKYYNKTTLWVYKVEYIHEVEFQISLTSK